MAPIVVRGHDILTGDIISVSNVSIVTLVELLATRFGSSASSSPPSCSDNASIAEITQDEVALRVMVNRTVYRVHEVSKGIAHRHIVHHIFGVTPCRQATPPHWFVPLTRSRRQDKRQHRSHRLFLVTRLLQLSSTVSPFTGRSFVTENSDLRPEAHFALNTNRGTQFSVFRGFRGLVAF
jgi:hypothetical protein